MLPNVKISEQLALLGSIDPVSQGVGSVSTGWISAANFERYIAKVSTGVLGASATVDAKIQQATDSSGTSAKDVTGKAITQIVKATGDGKQAVIDLRTDELDTNGGFGYFRLTVTVGTAASMVSGSVYGGVAKEYPASGKNASTVVQIV